MDDHDDTLRRLHDLGTQPMEPGRSARDLQAMAAVRPSARVGGKLRIAGAFLAGLLIGSTGLAAADALPDPAQHVAHTVLDRVGVQVPDPARYHGPECGSTAKKNHGAYVRDDHTLAQTDCGKKQNAVGAGESDAEHDGGPKAAKQAKGPCQGKPPWAGNKTMTVEEKAAAQAERTATCPADGSEETDEADELDARSGTSDPTLGSADSGDGEATTTTEAPTTTSESTTTTGQGTPTTAG